MKTLIDSTALTMILSSVDDLEDPEVDAELARTYASSAEGLNVPETCSIIARTACGVRC